MIFEGDYCDSSLGPTVPTVECVDLLLAGFVFWEKKLVNSFAENTCRFQAKNFKFMMTI
jgi:hypothetical protein